MIAAILGEGIRSFMHIPIRPAARGGTQPAEGSLQPGEVFGVFTVCYDGAAGFRRSRARLFTALAQRAALAVQNAQHFAAEQRRAEQFRVIGEVGRRITSILDVDQLLREVLGEINQAFGYEVMGIALIEGDDARDESLLAARLARNRVGAAAPQSRETGRDGLGGEDRPA